MSWLYSRALVEAFLAESCSDGEPSAQLNGSPTPQAYLSPDKMTAFSRLSQFGMTFKPLTENLGDAVLTWCQVGSRARTSASQGKAQELTVSDQECGHTWRGSLAKYDQNLSMWRTAQHSLLEDSDEFSVIWPRSGMTADGQCLELDTLAHLICERGYGSWPTPTKSDAKRCGDLKLHSLGKRAAIDGANWNFAEHVAAELDGYPNPEFVELLMGWPVGWTSLQPLETDKSHSAPQQPGDYSQVKGAA